MKKVLISIFALIFTVGFIFVSCKKSGNDNSLISGDAVFAEQAKSWFTTSFVNSTEYKNGTANGNFKIPNWKYGKTYSIGNIKMAEFPLIAAKKKVYISENLTEAESRIVVDNTKYKALFVQAPGKPIEVHIIQFTPAHNYLKNKNFDLSNLNFKNHSKDFTGDFMMFDFAGNFKKGYHYSGNNVKTISLRTKASNFSNTNLNTKNQSVSYESSSPNISPCDNGVEPQPGCYYTVTVVAVVSCWGGWNPDEGYNPNYCTMQEMTVNCELEYCVTSNTDLENCLNAGNTNAECVCMLYGFCEGGGEEESGVSCAILSDALANGTFTESTNTQGSGTVISETADEIERHDFFNLGEYNIPIWATFKFSANNKIVIEKISTTKKFKNYIFGETTKTGTSIWYSCVPSTLQSSNKTISPDKKTINGHHWYHFEISLLFQGCPVSEGHDRGVSFERKIADY